MSPASSYCRHVQPSRGAGALDSIQQIRLLAIGALLSLPLMAAADDNTLIQGYCGPQPPNSWFAFTSSTVSAVHSRLISTLTAQAASTYSQAVANYPGYPVPGCTVQVTPRPAITWCTNGPLDCTVQIDGDVQWTCGGQASVPAVNTFAIARGGCWAEAPAPPKPKVVVAIDPGHGADCAAANMLAGAIGSTVFSPSNPPAGRLREDVLTVAISQEVERIFSSSNVQVVLTKGDVNSCPSFKDRARVANDEKAKLLLSVHIDAANLTLLQDMTPSRNGSLGIYHRDRPASKPLADYAAAQVSSWLGLNNRGSAIDTRGLAILSPTLVRPPVAIVEVGRLSGTDEKILHSPAAVPAAAAGIKSAIESFLATLP
jgi:N-acetylmuramoyl-L-alanine amidase